MGPQQSNNPQPLTRVGWPPTRAAGRLRFLAALVMLACLTALALAAWLTPEERGYGTHSQLGLGKCGMLITTGLPCPTCGMTTAFAYTVRGRWIRGFLAQPTGFLLALATIACALAAGWLVVTGRTPPIRMPMITPYRLFFLLLVFFVGGWAFKIVVGLLTGALPDRS